MKKILTILAIFMSMVCGSVMLTACGNNKKMELQVEYAVPVEGSDDLTWKPIKDGGLDYTLTDEVYDEEQAAHILYLRVKVTGGKKKPSSLYISQSASNATILTTNTIKPNAGFLVWVKNVGSVNFKVTPAGKPDKSVAFNVNIYRELTDIEQYAHCVPALVTGGNVRLESLNLIKYYPFNDQIQRPETNQTGVNYTLSAVGTLVNTGEPSLLDRTFVANEAYSASADGLKIDKTNIVVPEDEEEWVRLDSSRGGVLRLEVSPKYALGNTNNVIKLTATSKHDETISTSVYVYIVENFENQSLLVSYNPDIQLTPEGRVPTEEQYADLKPVAQDSTITIYNSVVEGVDPDKTFNHIELYTYTNKSIYSYETNPGLKLNVYINGYPYDYNDVVDNSWGIQISPLHKIVGQENKLTGLKFEVNPNSNSQIDTYNIRLELDFTAFDFTASDKAPVTVLNKEFKIRIKDLASGFHINGKGYGNNLTELQSGSAININGYNSVDIAKLYTHYDASVIGMPLHIQATPTNAVDTKVYVGFYDSYTFSGSPKVFEPGKSVDVQLLDSQGIGILPDNNKFVINNTEQNNRLVYLKFSGTANTAALAEIFMVCEVVCTPTVFEGEPVEEQRVTFVSKIKVVGAVKNIQLYKDTVNNLLDDTYLQSNAVNWAYVKWGTNASEVEADDITITSTGGNVEFSADRSNWYSEINASILLGADGDNAYKKLYFRTNKECADSITISSPNGVSCTNQYQFVNVTSSADNIEVGFDKTYIWESMVDTGSGQQSRIDNVNIDGVDYAENVDLRYLALQSGRTVQFEAKGDGKNANIKMVTAKSLLKTNSEYMKIKKVGADTPLYADQTNLTFSSSAIKVINTGRCLFDVRANTDGFTSILLVKVDFYTYDDADGKIVEQSKYFVFEVGVYIPANNLTVTTDKDSILYVNNNYLTAATVKFTVGLNGATRQLKYSSTDVNAQINKEYGRAGDSVIYGIRVTESDNVQLINEENGKPYFKVTGLNGVEYQVGQTNHIDYFVDNETREFTIQANQSLAELQSNGQTSLWVDITIYQFGEETIHRIRKVIYFGDYEKSGNIIVDGVDKYNNVYLSLLTEESAKTTIYATVSNPNATYNDIGYRWYSVDPDNGELLPAGENLTITPGENGAFEIKGENVGGIYQLELYAKDSYDADIKDYKPKFKIRITVSDGQTEATAYLIDSLSDFVSIAGKEENLEKFYRLAKDVDVSALSVDNWWSKTREFAGFLDGAITIYDPNSGRTIYKCYSITGLRITNDSYKGKNTANEFGLFTWLTSEAVVKNIIFDRVMFDITLDKGNTSDKPVNIAAIAAENFGTIENCSVNIVASTISFAPYIDVYNSGAGGTIYNIGLIAGCNNNIISYNNTNVGSTYAYMADCNAGAELKIVVNKGNTNFDIKDTNLNVGGIVGQNATGATITSTYEDGSDQSIRTLITAVVNIDVLMDYDASNAPMIINNNLGGIAGYNAGTIKNVAISGELTANDRVNMGGIAGINTGRIQDCGNYGTHIVGSMLEDSYIYVVQGANKNKVYHGTVGADGLDLEQNIGGIVGFNAAGVVDNVRVMFILFNSEEVTVSAADATIEGVGNIGGIIGKATNTQLTRAYVENFVQDIEQRVKNPDETDEEYAEYLASVIRENSNIIGHKANVAGLIAASTSSSAKITIVNADFYVEYGTASATFHEFGSTITYEYAYFIGDISSDATIKAGEVTANKSYIIHNIISIDGEQIARELKEYGNSAISTEATDEVKLPLKDGQNDIVVVVEWRATTDINGGYPYLVYTYKDIADAKPVHTLTIRPDRIIVDVDEDYFKENAPTQTGTYSQKYEQGVFIQYVDDNQTTDTTDDEIRATAVVYYNENGQNTHKLISKDGNPGLIEKTLLPALADERSGAYSVSIIKGAQIATVTDGDKTITFSGVGVVELKFVSIYDRQIQDTVVIFVENELKYQDEISISLGAGLADRTGQGTNRTITTKVGTTALMGLNLNKVDERVFDSTKTYMAYSVGTAKSPTGADITNLETYFGFRAITAQVGTGRYSLGQFEINAKGIDAACSYMVIPVTVGVYLNLDKYTIDGIGLSDLMGAGAQVQLWQETINIIVYNKATGLSVSSDVTAEAGVGVTIIAQLTTGYVNESGVVSGHLGYSVAGELGDRLLLDGNNHDTVDLVLTAVNDNAKDLLQQAKEMAANPEQFSVWDLFDIVIGYELKTGIGYDFIISISLKYEYRYLDLRDYTDREWKFELQIAASSNNELQHTAAVWFVPQQLTRFDVENYSQLVSYVGDTNSSSVSEFLSSEVQSSLIIPGESGLVKIYAEYDYSYFERPYISYSTNDADNTYAIRFQQMVYNKDKKVYESYAGTTAEGNTLGLSKVSYSDGSYDGVMFVRTILDNIVGTQKTFNITAGAVTYDKMGNEIERSRTITVISQYRPGVYISVTNAITSFDSQNNLAYLVEENSSVTRIVARVYGYEFNVQPTISLTALNEGEVISVGEAAVVQQGEITTDTTGAYIINYALAVNTTKPFKVTMEMSLIDNGNTLTSNKEQLVFYPVPYIVNNVYLKGEANGVMNIAINTSRNIELIWNTKATTNAKTAAINEALEKQNIDFLRLFYIRGTDSNGMDQNKPFNDFLNRKDTAFGIRQNNDGTYRIESISKADAITVYFDLYYGYEFSVDADGKLQVAIVFGNDNTGVRTHRIHHEFRLSLTIHTTEEAPRPVTSQADLETMSPGENYILMNDIVVENWVPLKTEIASLDGNGKVIEIHSFNLTAQGTANVGLFDTVGEDTILKNVVVNLANVEDAIYVKDDNTQNVIVNFGFLAGVNNGLIYNCEIISITKPRTIEVVVGSTYSLTFGGLVGVNNGNITNSRVGTEYFERLNESNGNVSSAILSCGKLTFRARGVVAGFVGQNNSERIISSSYVANTTVENTYSVVNSTTNRTAGFVATNNGTIAYSYVKGLERSILETKARATGCEIYSSGTGNVAGFVYLNAGEIHDCYSNIICRSESAAVAGFVYDTTAGSIYQCYSASTVIAVDEDEPLATQMPFVGLGIEKEDANKLLSNKNMLNCYYLSDGADYDNYTPSPERAEAKGLSLLAFAKQSSLDNYSFITDSTSEQTLNGVWTYSTGVDKNKTTYSLASTHLPELTSANKISRSLRVYAEHSNSDIKSYKYPAGYELKSSKNPYIIRSVEEYKSVFVDEANPVGNEPNRKLSQTGYVRFIDNIDFKVASGYINIDTRSNYILGDQQNNTFTLIDGNGMTISNVVINYADDNENDNVGNLGLFSEVYYAVIKGLKVEYASQDKVEGSELGSTTVPHAGGIAGTAHNTYLIDINLSGAVTLRAHNVVGGVVGKLTGRNSGLYNITSDLNVQAGNYGDSATGDDRYVANQNVKSLSYAGGIAGIVDIGHGTMAETSFNINKMNVNGASVRANRAGGIAGYLGANVNAKRLTYSISSTSQVLGRKVAGAVVADNFADIQLSQATRGIEEQHIYDKAFGGYINSDQSLAINNDLDNPTTLYGNLNAVVGDQIVGGFIGVNYGGDIINSLTKANIGRTKDYDMAKTVGGFIGKTYGGNLKYVYAQNFIDLIYAYEQDDDTIVKDSAEIVGGLVGEIAYQNTASAAFGLDNVVVATWFDKAQINPWHTHAAAELERNPGKQFSIDYIAGKVDPSVRIYLADDETAQSPIVSYGVFNADETNDKQYEGGKIKNNNTLDEHFKNAQAYDMNSLYYSSSNSDGGVVTDPNSIFKKLFNPWPYDVWVKDYTYFMPNLKTDTATDYIEIDSEDDLTKFEEHPDANFVLVKDVEMGETYNNYVVNSEFTGLLTGALKEDGESYYSFIGIKIVAKTSADAGAGFFKSTNGARIENVNFRYEKIDLTGHEFAMVGGVSANDTDGEFEHIEVTQDSGSDAAIQTFDKSSIAVLGSIVGSGVHSQVVSCYSNLQYNVNTSNVGNSNQNVANIGGLVGTLAGLKDDPETGEIRYEGLIQSSTYSGQIDVKGNEAANIGGLVGSIQHSHISDSKAVIMESDEKLPVNICVANGETEGTNKIRSNIGGIAGSMDDTAIDGSYAEITIEDNSADTRTLIGNTYVAGGLVGRASNTLFMENSIVSDSYSKTTSKTIKAENIYMGGIIGELAGDIAVKLDIVAAELNVPAGEDLADKKYVGHYVVGGIIASAYNAGGKGVVEIVDAFTILKCDIEYSSTLIGGGIIGISSKPFAISNSTSMGQLFANNEAGKHITVASEPSLTVLGGIVGAVGAKKDFAITDVNMERQPTISNTYTVLTISTAKVFKGYVGVLAHDIYANAIVGKSGLSSTSKIGMSGVLYSSDYTLTFDESDSYSGTKPVNVTANVLTQAPTTLATEEAAAKTEGPALNGYIGDGWKWAQGHLPMPMATEDLLYKMGILTTEDGTTERAFKEDEEDWGTPYSPIVVDDVVKLIETKEYTYFLLTSDVNIISSKTELNGVLLGNAQTITSTVALFSEIGRHSGVTNLTFKLQPNFGGVAAVAAHNEGTIFMCGVEYNYGFTAADQFGGIAANNEGVINYCYNVGNADGNGDIGGIAYANTESARIENSYFTGSFSGGAQGSALVHSNGGYIGNSYSGGMALNFIAVQEESARYENVYFDYYANYTPTATYEESFEPKGIAAKPTAAMQAVVYNGANQTEVDNVTSSVLAGWKVYSLSNWDNTWDMTDKMTYNYGYPIHNFEQRVLKDGVVQYIPIRAKATGNGTLTATTDKDTGAVTGYNDKSFLISNLGILHMIGAMDTVDVTTETPYHYELEADIVLPDKDNDKYLQDSTTLISNWPGIGTTQKPFKGIFTSLPDGYGTEALDDTLLKEDTDAELNMYNETILLKVDKNAKTITNLTGGALFNCVEDGAIIANITLSNSRIRSATLIDNVGDTNKDNFATATVFKVTIKGDVMPYSPPKASQTVSMAGLVNTINVGKTLNVHSSQFSEFKLLPVNEATQTIAGIMSGLIYKNNGTLNLKDSFKEIKLNFETNNTALLAGLVNTNTGSINIMSEIAIDITSTGTNSQSVSGLVDVNSGSILTLADTTQIKIGELGAVTGCLSGVVREMRGGEIGGFEVTFDYGSDLPYEADVFGGVAAYLYGGNLGVREDEDTQAQAAASQGEKSITVKLWSAKTNVFGGVVAYVEQNAAQLEEPAEPDASQNAAAGAISNVMIKLGDSTAPITANFKDENPNNAYGMIIGHYNAELAEINYIIEDPITFKTNARNVGAIIGHASNSNFTFINEAQALVKVYGTGNVGGFIGLYDGAQSIRMKGADWAVGGTHTADEIVKAKSGGGSGAEYAQVELYIPDKYDAPNGGIRSITVSNFGGLIGAWKSAAKLEAVFVTIEGEGPEAEEKNETIQMVNSNKVLTDDESLGDNKGWITNIYKGNNYNGYNYTITNVGGIVGLSQAAITKATNDAEVGYLFEVGENPHGGKNPLFSADLSGKKEGSINQLKQIMYIGGVAGYIDCQGQPQIQFDITDCTSNAAISGMYAVGGLVGGSDGSVRFVITEQPEESQSEAAFVGLADVGGLIGKAFGATLEASDDITISIPNVIGIVNVGGVVGYAQIATIQNVVVEVAEVMGNMNVSTMIGYAEECTIDNSSSTEESVVYGTVFEYYDADALTASLPDKEPVYYHLPLNIGGVVGYASKARFNTVTINTMVKTDEKYVTGKTDTGEELECTVHMNKNYYGSVDAIETKTSISIPSGKLLISYLQGYYNTTESNVQVNYNAVDGGIGGFAGRLDEATFVKEEVGEPVVETQTNAMAGSVYAPLGINVGGAVGYYGIELTNSIEALPTLSMDPDNPSRVAGKVFVGGFVGRVTSSKGYTWTINKGYINVQEYISEEDDTLKVMTGRGIGGIIGYSNGNIEGLKLESGELVSEHTSPLKVFNSNGTLLDSEYVGVIVGQLDGDMSACSVSKYLCDYKVVDKYDGYKYEQGKTVDITGIIQSPRVFNYGGLVGVMNIIKDARHSAAKVQGEHYYPFTVDLVQNRDYEQGQPVYSYIEGENAKELTANTHYINMSNIQVSASRLTAMYGGRLIGSGNTYSAELAEQNYNPIVGKSASGWAKEYTMFRTMARVIEQEEYTGDSVQIIYNARYITHVRTAFDDKNISNEIIYTIYQPVGQTARLYCKYGIAVEDANFEDGPVAIEHSAGFDVNNPKYFTFEKNYKVELYVYDDKTVDWAGYTKTYKKEEPWQKVEYKDDGGEPVRAGLGRAAFWKHIDDPLILGVNPNNTEHVNDKTGKLKESIDEDVHDNSKRDQLTFGYTFCEVTNYLGKGTVPFVFETVFGKVEIMNGNKEYIQHNKKDDGQGHNNANEEVGDNDKSAGYVKVGGDTNYYSASGSLFEVNGTSPHIGNNPVNDQFWNWFWAGVTVFATIAGIALAVITGGKSVVLTKTAGLLASLVKAAWVTTKLVKSAMIAAIVVGLISGGGGLAFGFVGKATMNVEGIIGGIEDSSLGYLYSAYGRSISWRDGEMDPQAEGVLVIEVPVEFTMKTGSDLSSNINLYMLSNEHTELDKDRLGAMNIDSDSLTGKISLMYISCASSRTPPANINQTTDVVVAEMQNNDITAILNALGIHSIRVPKYASVDNDLYQYSYDTSNYGTLYANYEDVLKYANDPENDMKKSEIIEEGGYGYVLDSIHNRNNHIVPETHIEHLANTYGVDRIITRNVKHSVSKTIQPERATKEVKQWTAVWPSSWTSNYDPTQDETIKNDEGIYSVKMYFHGEDNPGTRSISREAIYDGSTWTYYYLNKNGKYENMKGDIWEGDVSDTTRVYFTLSGRNGNKTGDSVDAIFKPTDGDGFLRPVGVPAGTTFYFVMDPDNGTYNINADFGLCKHTKFKTTPGDPHIYDSETNTGNAGMLDILAIELWKYNPNPTDEDKKLYEGNDLYFIPLGKVSLKTIAQNWSEYSNEEKNYSVSNITNDPLVNHLEFEYDGMLDLKDTEVNITTTTTNDFYLVDYHNYGFGDYQAYVYAPSHGGVEMSNNFMNKYVYNTVTIEGNEPIKLYTRYYYGSDFLGYEFALENEEGNKEFIPIKDIILPKSNKGIANKTLIFGESVRVSLSIGGRDICISKNNWSTGQHGTIQCL